MFSHSLTHTNVHAPAPLCTAMTYVFIKCVIFQIAKHTCNRSSKFANCWAALDPVYQNYFVSRFVDSLCFVHEIILSVDRPRREKYRTSTILLYFVFPFTYVNLFQSETAVNMTEKTWRPLTINRLFLASIFFLKYLWPFNCFIKRKRSNLCIHLLAGVLEVN